MKIKIICHCVAQKYIVFRYLCPLQVTSTATLEGKGQLKFTSGKWSPHHNCGQLATANDTAIRGWDLRTMR